MKNILLTIGLIIMTTFLTFGQETTHQEINCSSKKVQFYDNTNFEYVVKKVITIEKREGVNSFEDLNEDEIKRLEKEAKSAKCCIIVCDFDYQTPKSLKKFNQKAEEEKKNYFHFYIANKLEEMK